MAAILILLIISAQFAICYFAVKHLLAFNEKLIKLNSAVLELKPKIRPLFKSARLVMHKANKAIEIIFKNEDKFKMIRKLMIIKSLIAAFILFKQRKNIFQFFSLYGLLTKFTKAVLEL